MVSAKLAYIDLWDVGQADSSVLNFSDGSVLLIDVGLRGSPIVDWLSEHPRQIRGIVLTHNDSDHAGALCSLVKFHKERIRCIYMLQDRPKDDPKFQRLFRCANEGEKLGYYKIEWATAGKVLWQSETGRTRIMIVHPSFSEFIDAPTPNEVSAMVVLERDDRWLAIWPGDMLLEQLASKAGGKCPTILIGPHHGAPADYKKRPDSERWINEVFPRRSFISVGTKNTYGHPRPGYIELLARTGCRVVCSGLTRACDPERVRVSRPVFPGTGMLGLRPARSELGVACRGSLRLFFKDGALHPDNFDAAHLSRIALLRRPMCLMACGWRRGQPPPSFEF